MADNLLDSYELHDERTLARTDTLQFTLEIWVHEQKVPGSSDNQHAVRWVLRAGRVAVNAPAHTTESYPMLVDDELGGWLYRHACYEAHASA